MDKNELTQFVNKLIELKLDSMTNMAVSNHYHNSWDSNQLDPSVALSGFPVYQVATASVAPTFTPFAPQGKFIFQVDTTPTYYLWAYLIYTSGTTATGAWKGVALT